MGETANKAGANVLNFNLGILGHVDSGKTSLARAVSTVASTAAFDKNPQSRDRGITLDLGFSSFTLPIDETMTSQCSSLADFEKVQLTLVDCPGHASLIRTVIGGSQIIDLVVLVIDATKGVQTQTAECLLLAEITCPTRMIVVTNKIDLLPENTRATSIEKLHKRLRKTLENTTFKHASIVALSASPGASLDNAPEGLESLIDALKRSLFIPQRSSAGKFLFAVDHCFGIRGQGTILTGTVLSGKVSVGDTVELPAIRETKKIKSMQVFRKPVQAVSQGDRAGICVTQLEASLFERGLVCEPGSVPAIYGAIVTFEKIPYFKAAISSKARFHVSVSHETVMARVWFFAGGSEDDEFRFESEYKFVEEVGQRSQTENAENATGRLFALLQFDQPVLCPFGSIYIASRLDSDINANTCRLAFHGQLLHAFTEKDYQQHDLNRLKLYKNKSRTGKVERLADDYTVIVHSLFKKETNLEIFRGLKVELSSGESGYIEGGFGQSGKVKVRVPTGLTSGTIEKLEALAVSKKKNKKVQAAESTEATVGAEHIVVKLSFKRYLFRTNRQIVQ